VGNTAIRIEQTLSIALVNLVFKYPCSWFVTICIVPVAIAASEWVWRACEEFVRAKWESSSVRNAKFAVG